MNVELQTLFLTAETCRSWLQAQARGKPEHPQLLCINLKRKSTATSSEVTEHSGIESSDKPKKSHRFKRAESAETHMALTHSFSPNPACLPAASGP